MSAWICSDSHITALAAFAIKHELDRPHDGETHQRLQCVGQMLLDENYRSVNHRHNRTGNAAFRPCEWALDQQFSALEIMKAAHCLNYQSCEHDEWEASKAHALLLEICWYASTGAIGYNAAPWGIDKPARRATVQK